MTRPRCTCGHVHKPRPRKRNPSTLIVKPLWAIAVDAVRQS